jgi:hypothetical protein
MYFIWMLQMFAKVSSVKGPNMAKGGVNSLFKNLQITRAK